MREIFALVDWVHAELEVGEGERREENGENSPDWRRSVGWSCVSLSSVRRGGAEGFRSGCFLLELELVGL